MCIWPAPLSVPHGICEPPLKRYATRMVFDIGILVCHHVLVPVARCSFHCASEAHGKAAEACRGATGAAGAPARAGVWGYPVALLGLFAKSLAISRPVQALPAWRWAWLWPLPPG